MATLTVAVVDDSGRLLEYCEISDDPAGFAMVTSLLAERFGGTATPVTLAVDNDDHLVVSLLSAAGRAIAYTDDENADTFAEHFADAESLEELQAAPGARRAVGLARALQAGALSAVVNPAPREFAALKPVLSAHAAVATGRQAAAVALREVLRELYPAALRAYPDPAGPVALAVLQALPEPGMLVLGGAPRGRDSGLTGEAVMARLVADGVCAHEVAYEAVTALSLAIQETPKRPSGAKNLNSAIADAVRHSVAAVRSADLATNALLHSLAERVAPGLAATPTQRRNSITITSAPPAQVPPARRRTQPVGQIPHLPQPVSRPAWAQNTPPQMPPGFEPTPVTGVPVLPPPRPIPAQRVPMAPLPAPAETFEPFVPTLTQAAISSERAARAAGLPLPPLLDPTPLPIWQPDSLMAPTDIPRAFPEPEATPVMPGARSNWPLIGEHDDQARPGRVTPPWQADDLVLPDVPSLRLVEPIGPPVGLGPDELTGPLSIIEETPRPGRSKPRRTERTPGSITSDDDLLIFASVSSAWFTDEGETTWNSSADLGWRAAEQASHPSIGGENFAGLPRRVPTANLVPGSAQSTGERPLRIVRDAADIAAHTSNYFRGWRRGNQEVGGFSVGGRPGRGSESGWDFSREPEGRDEYDDYGYRDRDRDRAAYR